MLHLHPRARVRALEGLERREPLCDVLVAWRVKASAPHPFNQHTHLARADSPRTLRLVEVIRNRDELRARQVVRERLALGGRPVACAR